MSYAIVWFRRDLRLEDNPALSAALEAGYAPIPVYIDAPGEEGEWMPGAASRAWLHCALRALRGQLRARGSELVLRQGESLPILCELIVQSKAQAVYWNRKYEPATQSRDATIKRVLREQGLQAHSCNGALLLEPWEIATKQGGPYRVFTPYWRSAQAQLRLPRHLPAPRALPALPLGLHHGALDALGLRPARGWEQNFWKYWRPGEAGAHEALAVFVEGALRDYQQARDWPGRIGTSQLSPHLHFGEIAPWRICAELEQHRNARTHVQIDAYLRQLGWREFAYHLLHHFPQTPVRDLNPRFAGFAWEQSTADTLQAWRHGRTGIPIVDAGMRQLWRSGWMHNRVRMLVASVLCKHLRVHWSVGARWFWDTLVDADLANNTLGWQWVAGTGADAAPYFRIFNPVSQAEKFDPQAGYITQWLPELAQLPVQQRFAPWLYPQQAARLAPDYPRAPVVDLATGRAAALEAYARIRDVQPKQRMLR